MGFDKPTESVDPTNLRHEIHGRNQKQILRPTKYSEVELWMWSCYDEPLMVVPLSQRKIFGISGDGASSLLNGCNRVFIEYYDECRNCYSEIYSRLLLGRAQKF